jgi:NAD(P)-dependent dehydrogenase (short-subunit alcohol dehydrogenase family)
VRERHGGVDFLVNNAGRSIRRAIESSYDRFHDFERTMQLNYFGALRVTMGLLPSMVERRGGHVRIATRLGVFGQVLHAVLPRVAQVGMNTTFRMFPDSTAAAGQEGEPGNGARPQLSAEAIALQQMLRGIHF